MINPISQRTIYLLSIALVLILGVASRVFHTGLALIDKYLGDALYAILVYLLLSLAWGGRAAGRKAALAGAIVLAIEAFQLTGIPARLARSDSLALRLLAVALGMKWSWWDVLAYAVGIAAFALFDRVMKERGSGRAQPSPKNPPTSPN
jgi:hypothetical protein